jgi:tripartite-type tricarboxylate transporter receptor subunit TctC
MKKLACLATLLLAFALPLASQAQAPSPWPAKTVRIISPFPPGGSVDQVSRILAAQLSTQTGQQFIVENRTGASGVIGTQAVASAPPDGYTWGVVFDTHAVNPALMPSMPYDTLKDLSNVMLIGTSPMAIVAHRDQPFRDFRDVLAAAKRSPVAIGSIGTGSLGHLAIAQIGSSQGAQFNHIPYKGGGPLMIDAVGGQVPLAIGTVFLAMPHVKGGKVKALAVTSPKRSPQLPDVGTVAEQGVPEFSALAWWGFIGPANLPPAIRKQMYDQLSAAIRNPGVVEKLSQQGMDISGGGPEEMDKFLRAEMTRWAEIARQNKIRAGD